MKLLTRKKLIWIVAGIIGLSGVYYVIASIFFFNQRTYVDPPTLVYNFGISLFCSYFDSFPVFSIDTLFISILLLTCSIAILLYWKWARIFTIILSFIWFINSFGDLIYESINVNAWPSVIHVSTIPLALTNTIICLFVWWVLISQDAKLMFKQKGNTSDIDDFGFLGKSIAVYENNMQKKYADILNFYKEVNHFLNKFKCQLEATSDEGNKIIIITLFVKSLETYQSIYFLFTKCLHMDAKSSLRTLSEIMIKIAYCCQGESYYKRYICTHYHKIRSWINAAENRPDEFPKEFLTRGSLEERKNEVARMLAEAGNPLNINVEQMARETGLIKLYNAYYRTACDDVHSNPSTLEEYVILNEKGDVKRFFWGPQDQGPIALLTALNFMVIILKGVEKFFNLNIADKIQFFEERGGLLSNKYLPESK